MSVYFSYFPKIKQDINADGTTTEAVNILRRFKIRNENYEKSGAYYDYEIQDGDRPDIIAEKYYGNSNYAWVVLFYNKIHDPFYEWPLFGNTFRNFLVSKYGSVETAQTQIRNYNKIIRQESLKVGGTRVPALKLEIDINTYNSLDASSREIVYAYDYEVELNDARRSIRLLDKKFLSKIANEVKTIVRTGV
jgi:hypothetical protein